VRARGFALVYILAITVILLLVVEAMLISAHGTLRATVRDWELLRARRTSELASDLAFVLFRDRSSQWYDEHQDRRWTNEDFPDPRLSVDSLQARFWIEVVDRGKITNENQVFPNGGTYKLIKATAEAGGRRAETTLVVKFTNPSVNNMVVSEGHYAQLGSDEALDGPVLVTSDPERGLDGDFRFVHFHRAKNKDNDKKYHVRFGGEIRAQGKVYIQNTGPDGKPFGERRDIAAVLPPGPISVGEKKGAVEITRESPIDVEEIATGVPGIRDLLAAYRDPGGHGSRFHRLDVTDPDGVLVEFGNQQAYVHTVRWDSVGKCYDRSLVAEGGSHLNKAGRDVMIAEALWDDPAFNNDGIPADLAQHLPDELKSGKGDYFEVKRACRNTKLLEVALHQEEWTILYLRASKNTFTKTHDKGPTQVECDRFTAPPVFVRGRVDGKVVVVYDQLEEDADDSFASETWYNRYHMYILSEHEDRANDSGPPLNIPIPGGIHYADRSLSLNPADGGSSNDQVLLLCRGSIRGSGLAGRTLSYLYRGNDRVNYKDRLDKLDDRFAGDYDATYRLVNQAKPGADHPITHLDGVGIAYRTQWSQNRVTAEGKVVVEADKDHRWWCNEPEHMESWKKTFGGSFPDPIKEDKSPILPGFMRHAAAPYGSAFRVYGGLNSLGTQADLLGDVHFDYRWRDNTASELREEIQVPVGPVLMDKNQR